MSTQFEEFAMKEFAEIRRQFAKLGKLEEKIDNLQDRFVVLEEKVDNLQNRLVVLEKKVDNLQDRIVVLEEKVTDLQDSLARTDRSVALIEDQVTNKIPALFDAYALNRDKIGIQQQDIDSAKEKLENHDIRISFLEQKQLA